MDVYSFDRNEINSIMARIRDDIHKLKMNGISDSRIKISMPNFLKELFIYHERETFLYTGQRPELYNLFFGMGIIPGYNNQVCVFDELATPTGFQNEPFLIQYNVKQKTYSEVSEEK